MPYLPAAQDWLTQSSLLLQARPTSTRISTKYTLVSSSTKSKRVQKSRAPPSTADPTAPRGVLTLKTFDPVSGVTLKYETTKAQEVGRLISALGRLGRGMARLPELEEDVAMGGVDDGGVADGVRAVDSGVATPVPEGVRTPAAGQASGGGGKKKKKGKK